MALRSKVIAFAAVGLAILSACTGYIESPPSVPANALGVACPTIAPVSRTGCPGVSIAGPSLTCGGDGRMTVATSPVGSGGTRFVVRLQDDSVFRGTVTPFDGVCKPGIPVPITVNLGVVYTGDQGTEPAAGGGTIPCIVRSKAQFTQFSTADPIINLFEQPVKDMLHGTFDNVVINQVFVSPGTPPLPGRCARWRPL
jgi:hypothetical protein